MFIEYLTSLGHKCERAPKRVFYDWDIKSTFLVAKYGFEITEYTFTWEIKYDSSAYLWAERRGTPNKINAYIEFENTNQSKPSGIAMSKANYYVYIVKVDDNSNDAYIFDTQKLLTHLRNSNYKVVGNKARGDDNAKGYLLPISIAVKLGENSGFIKKITL